MPIGSDRIVKCDRIGAHRSGAGFSAGIQFGSGRCANGNRIAVRIRRADDHFCAKAKMDIARLACCQRTRHFHCRPGHRRASFDSNWLAWFVKLLSSLTPLPQGEG